MLRILQYSILAIAVFACFAIPGSFTDSLEDTPVHIIMDGIREVDRHEPFTESQRSALGAATQAGFKALSAERGAQATREAKIWGLGFLISMVSFGSLQKTRSPIG